VLFYRKIENKFMNNEQEFVELIDAIISNFAPDKIILFGSRATGKYNENSDYDIMVLKSNIEYKRKFTHELYKLLINKFIPVDFIVETPEKFDIIKENPFMIYHEIEQNGKVIYEKK
jgi:uncharacterized protein